MHLGVYILVQVEKGEPWQIAAAISKIDGIKTAHTVTGQYDIIVYGELSDLENLKSLAKKIQGIEGVQHTQTAVCIP